MRVVITDAGCGGDYGDVVSVEIESDDGKPIASISVHDPAGSITTGAAPELVVDVVTNNGAELVHHSLRTTKPKRA
jgi:hypothetical protein